MLCEHFAMGETLIVTEKYDFETAGTLYPSNVPRASQILEAIPIDILSSLHQSSNLIADHRLKSVVSSIAFTAISDEGDPTLSGVPRSI
jgi:hypothetical protein